jgi:hypothetical protein
MMQNQHGISNVKQNEDQKPMLQQQQALVTVTKQEETAARQVQNKDNPEREEYRFDAREGGGNQYKGNGKKKKSKQQKEKMEDGQVRIKGMSGGFDIMV